MTKTTKFGRKCIVTALGLATCLGPAACTTVPASFDVVSKDAIVSKTTKTQLALRALTPPQTKVTVAVYNFEDKTGQFRPTEAGQTLSRAVSQGGDELLIKALHDAGNRSWFTVIERSNLNNLLKERQIITEMRSRYLGETTINSKALPPLLFAGVIFEGGIVGFDTNTLTGGAAARYLGIGGQTDYRQNVVSVHLRAVSVKTGEVLASVTTEKTIASFGVSANAFRFVTFDNLLEADAGITSNEPGLLALRQAIEKSVYALVLEGSEIGLWDFKDKSQGLALLESYKHERDGTKPSKKISKADFATKTDPKKVALKQSPRPVKFTRAQTRKTQTEQVQIRAAKPAQLPVKQSPRLKTSTQAQTARVQKSTAKPATLIVKQPLPLPTSIVAPPSRVTHKVVQGDTLYNISQRYDVSVDELRAANDIGDNIIGVGKVLTIPGPNAVNETTAPQLTTALAQDNFPLWGPQNTIAAPDVSRSQAFTHLPKSLAQKELKAAHSPSDRVL